MPDFHATEIISNWRTEIERQLQIHPQEEELKFLIVDALSTIILTTIIPDTIKDLLLTCSTETVGAHHGWPAPIGQNRRIKSAIVERIDVASVKDVEGRHASVCVTYPYERMFGDYTGAEHWFWVFTTFGQSIVRPDLHLPAENPTPRITTRSDQRFIRGRRAPPQDPSIVRLTRFGEPEPLSEVKKGFGRKFTFGEDE